MKNLILPYDSISIKIHNIPNRLVHKIILTIIFFDFSMGINIPFLYLIFSPMTMKGDRKGVWLHTFQMRISENVLEMPFNKNH